MTDKIDDTKVKCKIEGCYFARVTDSNCCEYHSKNGSESEKEVEKSVDTTDSCKTSVSVSSVNLPSIEERVLEQHYLKYRLSKNLPPIIPSGNTEINFIISLTSQLVREERHQCLVCGEDGILQLCTSCRDKQLESVRQKILDQFDPDVKKDNVDCDVGIIMGKRFDIDEKQVRQKTLEDVFDKLDKIRLDDHIEGMNITFDFYDYHKLKLELKGESKP